MDPKEKELLDIIAYAKAESERSSQKLAGETMPIIAEEEHPKPFEAHAELLHNQPPAPAIDDILKEIQGKAGGEAPLVPEVTPAVDAAAVIEAAPDTDEGKTASQDVETTEDTSRFWRRIITGLRGKSGKRVFARISVAAALVLAILISVFQVLTGTAANAAFKDTAEADAAVVTLLEDWSAAREIVREDASTESSSSEDAAAASSSEESSGASSDTPEESAPESEAESREETKPESNTPQSSKPAAPSGEREPAETNNDSPPVGGGGAVVGEPPAAGESAGNSTGGEDKSGASSPAESPAAPAGEAKIKVKNSNTGKVVEDTATNILAMIIEAEMGSGYHIEALKAQAVAAYSWLCYNGLNSGRVPSAPMKTPGGRAKEATAAVKGLRVLSGGNACNATYFAISAGRTANSQDIWGGTVSYLSSVDSGVDSSAGGFSSTRTYSAANVQKWVKDQYGVDLAGVDKNNWFQVSYSADGLYAKSVSLGGKKTVTGEHMRAYLFVPSRTGSQGILRSPAFKVTYDAAGDCFLFDVKGYGHGVGMSQVGANAYAGQGWDYKKILAHYYSGTTVG